jgi:hypothetical protein
MDAVLDEARDRGVKTVRLEVIDANEAAVALYRVIGFEHVRDVEVWTLERDPGPGGAAETAVDDALALIRSLRREREPWQRDDGSVQRMRELGRPLRALAVADGAVVFRLSDTLASVVQVEARTEDAAASLLASVRAEATTLHALNLPTDVPAAAALRALGGRVDFRQHELALDI